MDVDYSPTGREFVAGSYDRSVRIFGYNAGHSREVRAQRRCPRSTPVGRMQWALCRQSRHPYCSCHDVLRY